jgi:hypothetical protein
MIAYFSLYIVYGQQRGSLFNLFSLCRARSRKLNIKIGNNSRLSHFVKRKVDALLRDETIKPEETMLVEDADLCWQ